MLCGWRLYILCMFQVPSFDRVAEYALNSFVFVRQNINFHLCIFKKTFPSILCMCFTSFFTHLAPFYGIIGSGFLVVVFHICFMKCGINLIHLKIPARIPRCLRELKRWIWCQYSIWEWFHCTLCIPYTLYMHKYWKWVESMIYVRWAWMCFVHLNCLFRFFNKTIFSIFSSFVLSSFENFDFRYAGIRMNILSKP